MDTGVQAPLEISAKEITVETDTRDILEHARRQGEIRNFENVFICDIDSHHVETESWGDLAQYIEDEVLRFQAIDHLKNRGKNPGGILPWDIDFNILPHTLTIWAGMNGHGKSLIVQQVMLYLMTGDYSTREEKV